MIALAAHQTDDGFIYRIAQTGGAHTTTAYSWEAVEILLELGVEDPVPLILEAQKWGSAVLRRPVAALRNQRNFSMTAATGQRTGGTAVAASHG